MQINEEKICSAKLGKHEMKWSLLSLIMPGNRARAQSREQGLPRPGNVHRSCLEEGVPLGIDKHWDWTLKIDRGAGDIAPLGRNLSHNHEDPSSTLSTPTKKGRCEACS